MSDEYINIQIHIHAFDEVRQFYPVEAALCDGSFFSDGQLRLNQENLLISRLDPEEYGLELFRNLFSGPILNAYNTATGYATARTEGRLRVELRIDNNAVKLHPLPWEQLYHWYQGRSLPLAATELTPFSRYTPQQTPLPDPVKDRPIRLLIAIANPPNLPPGMHALDVNREVDNLCQALGDLRRATQIKVTLLPGQSGLSQEMRELLVGEGYQIEEGATSLERILQLLPRCHILHLLSHGHFRREEGISKTALHLERREDGAWQPVWDTDFGDKLRASGSRPHLVFMAACESARRYENDPNPFMGLGPKLVEAGVPAVVAMQDVVPMELARQITSEFYRCLVEHGVVDRALNQARLLVSGSDRVDWAIPVLFMRLKKGQLFVPESVEQKQTVSVSKGLTALSELMQVPDVRDAVIISQADFKGARKQIDILADYKNLHDLLHKTQFSCYEPIKNFLKDGRSSKQDVDWEDLEKPKDDLDLFVEGLQEVVDQASKNEHHNLAEKEAGWIQKLVEAREEVHGAIENCDFNRLKKAELVIRRVLTLQPSRINNVLNDLARNLYLRNLESGMKSIYDNLAYMDLDLDKVREFKDGVDNLVKLKHRLATLLEEHDSWQEVHKLFNLIEANLTPDNTDELEDSWLDLKELTEPLYIDKSDRWTVSFKAESEKLAGAIAASNPTKEIYYFDRYRNRASNRFYNVDAALKRLCDALVLQVGEALSLVLRVLR